MEIGVLEGYRVPRSRGGRKMKGWLRKKMKSCAKKHRVATRGFWACVRGGRRRRK